VNIRPNTNQQDSRSDNRPIGIFDSGVGGLSVLQHSRQLLPRENFIYIADSGYAPWGCKDNHFIEQRSRVITEHLLAQHAKLIVIACNTATASIIETFRDQYEVPFVGVEPGIKPAISLSKNTNIGIMATKGTMLSQRYKELIQRFSNSVNLYHSACPGLADQVESGQINTAKTIALVEEFVQPLMKQQVDSIVLGCTHYSFLSTLIQKITGDSIFLVDTSRAIAEQIVRIINQYQLKNNEGNGTSRFFTTGDLEKTRLVMNKLLNQPIDNLTALNQ